MKIFIYSFVVIAVSYGIFSFLSSPNTMLILPDEENTEQLQSTTSPEVAIEDGVENNSTTSLSEEEENVPKVVDYQDIGPQAQLINPPKVAKGIYVTAWSAGSSRRIGEIMDLIDRTEVNAIIIDIKDYSGFVSYYMDIPLVKEAGADRDIRIVRPNALIKQLHDRGIYVIGRVTVFQDPRLAKIRPEWAISNVETGETWEDRKGLAWMDPASSDVWDYNISIAKDAFMRGFDEINFDYVRFPSDGNLSLATYPVWDEVTLMTSVMRDFFSYTRKALSGELISADLFGLVTVNYDGLGIGQILEDAYQNFDFVAPMIYPSHYAPGFIGYAKPAEYPYEVMKYSLDHAYQRWLTLRSAQASLASTTVENIKLGKLRPWIQDFDLGAVYTVDMVRSEYKAVYDSLGTSSYVGAYAGWYVWDPTNRYTEDALQRVE